MGRVPSAHTVRPLVVLTAALGWAAVAATAQEFPEPPVPAENPITEEKRVLGKLLFWEEQLSSDNTMACGTCHIPAHAGNDPRLDRRPGPDGLVGTPDDVFGSAGVIATDAAGDYAPDARFGLAPQITDRAANSVLMAAFSPTLFWDGRAPGALVDPVSEETVIAAGAALESQALDPPVSDVEMAHADRDWVALTAKLAAVVPMRLASDLPPDMAAVLTDGATYPDLFAAAFGDPDITPVRIAFALATYQRTLVPDQTPLDRFAQGDPGALTPRQDQGLSAMQASGCTLCHRVPQFTDHSFRNIGLRPVDEDRGLQEVTGDPADRGKFKVPSLRNAALKRTFMHTGQFTSLEEVLRFYAREPGTEQFPDNRDLIVEAIHIPAELQADIVHFLETALTDPRVASEQFPFDRPTLFSERTQPNPSLQQSGVAGSGGRVPQIVAVDPPNLGHAAFRIGLADALGGTDASLVVARTEPVAGELAAGEVHGPLRLPGSGAGEGFATVHWPIDTDPALLGDVVYFQWRVDDPAAPGGVALSQVARAEVFSFADETGRTPPPDDPPDAAPQPLYVASAKFRIDPRDGRGDALVIRGVLNPAGAAPEPAGAQVRVTLGGEPLAGPFTLDARGRSRSARTSGPRHRVRFDPRTGAYAVALANVELADRIGLGDAEGAGTVGLDLGIDVQGVGLDQAAASASLVFRYARATGRASGRATKGAFSIRRDAELEPVFAALSTRVTKGATPTSYRVKLKGALAAAHAASLVPTGPLTLHVGDADPVTIPLASLRLRGGDGRHGFRFRPASGDVPGLRKLAYDHRRRSLRIVLASISGLGLPQDASQAADVDIRLEVPTVEGAQSFATRVEVQRTSGAKRAWAR